MSKKEIFRENKNNLVKKMEISIITIILLATSITPLVSSCKLETPDIDIVKTGPIFAYAGDEITYNYYISNIGDVALSKIKVNDDKCGEVEYVSGDINENKKLDTDEIWMFTCTYTPEFTFPNVLENTANVSGKYKSERVEDMDDYSLYPYILRKNVLLYWEGKNIDYIDPDTQFKINLSKNEEFLDTITISESTPKHLWLNEGTYQFCEVDLPDGYESAYGCISYTTEESYPDFTHINVITFDLVIEKSGPENCYPGNEITYYYQLSNKGPASVTPIVEDDLCGNPVYTGGDTDKDDLIDPGEIWIYECNYMVVEELGSIIHNTANVTDDEGANLILGEWWLGGDRNISNNVDSWSVEVIEEPEKPEEPKEPKEPEEPEEPEEPKNPEEPEEPEEPKEPEEALTTEEFMKLLNSPNVQTTRQTRSSIKRRADALEYFQRQEYYWWCNQQISVLRFLDEKRHQDNIATYNTWVRQCFMPRLEKACKKIKNPKKQREFLEFAYQFIKDNEPKRRARGSMIIIERIRRLVIERNYNDLEAFNQELAPLLKPKGK